CSKAFFCLLRSLTMLSLYTFSDISFIFAPFSQKRGNTVHYSPYYGQQHGNYKHISRVAQINLGPCKGISAASAVQKHKVCSEHLVKAENRGRHHRKSGQSLCKSLEIRCESSRQKQHGV